MSTTLERNLNPAAKTGDESVDFSLMSDFRQLIRPRLVLTVLFTVGLAAWSVGAAGPSWASLAHALVGTGLVIVGAIAFNQLIERVPDGLMFRTASRPLPARRLSPRVVAVWGVATSAAGIAYLAIMTAPGVLITAAVSWGVYVCLYTPLKRITVWHTAVGAVSGALPVLIGAATVGAEFHPVALVLFGVAYLWQWPHTMAIGLLYRDQYAAAGIRVAPVVDDTGRLAGGLAVGGALALLGTSLLLPWLGPASWGFAVFSIVLGGFYLASSIRFAKRYDRSAARQLLRISLLYLPLLLTGYLIAVRL